MSSIADVVTFRDKLHAIYLIVLFKPKFTGAIVLFGLLTALLEGVGVTFVVPLIEVAQAPEAPPDDGLVGAFATVYSIFGVSFTGCGSEVRGALLRAVNY